MFFSYSLRNIYIYIYIEWSFQIKHKNEISFELLYYTGLKMFRDIRLGDFFSYSQ